MALPNKDYDVTETAVPWKTLTTAGFQVDFATEDGVPGECDPRLLEGVIFGQLGAAAEPKKFYLEMIKTQAFLEPLKFANIDFMSYDCLLLPGGHAKGMIQYLECELLREKIVPFFKDESKIVGAICHGVLVLARTIDPSTGKSILFQRKSSVLPKYMERAAFFVTAWKLGRYYRTYSKYVEDELCEVMENPKTQYDSGTRNLLGNLDKKYASVCVDKNYVSARWPGDAYLYSNTILEKLNNKM